MQGKRNPFVAREGIPFLAACLLLGWLAFRYAGPVWLAAVILLFVLLALVFRDPRRRVPAVPLGVVSPVDGVVVEAGVADTAVLQGEAQRILIRIDALGTYTARCPVEGKIMDLNAAPRDSVADYPRNALWVRTDEGDDVVLYFRGYRFGLPPKSFVRYGERLGQGARCAYLRLTRYAEIHLPEGSKLIAAPGMQVVAGRDVIGKVPHH